MLAKYRTCPSAGEAAAEGDVKGQLCRRGPIVHGPVQVAPGALDGAPHMPRRSRRRLRRSRNRHRASILLTTLGQLREHGADAAAWRRLGRADGQPLTDALDNSDGDALCRRPYARAEAEDVRRRVAEREAQSPCARGAGRGSPSSAGRRQPRTGRLGAPGACRCAAVATPTSSPVRKRLPEPPGSRPPRHRGRSATTTTRIRERSAGCSAAAAGPTRRRRLPPDAGERWCRRAAARGGLVLWGSRSCSRARAETRGTGARRRWWSERGAQRVCNSSTGVVSPAVARRMCRSCPATSCWALTAGRSPPSAVACPCKVSPEVWGGKRGERRVLRHIGPSGGVPARAEQPAEGPSVFLSWVAVLAQRPGVRCPAPDTAGTRPVHPGSWWSWCRRRRGA